MAARYVYSGAAGAGTGADWANAHVDLSSAITASSAGDTFYVAHDHSKNYGVSTTLTFKGTTSAPDRIICVNRAGSVPPVAADITTGAVEGTNAATTTLSISGCFKMIGVTLAPGSGQSTACTLILSNATGNSQAFENCTFSLLSTGTASRINIGNANSRTWCLNCKLKFGATAQGVVPGAGHLTWVGPSSASILAAGSSVPTTLIIATIGAPVKFVGVDFSALSGTIIGASATWWPADLVNCKLHASATVAGTPTDLRHLGVTAIGCHSSGIVERNEKYLYQGTLTTETTIVRTGGASDGTTPYSWKVVSTANSKRDFPFETFPRELWNATTGVAKTLTVHCVTDNVTLKDDEICIEVEYLGSSGSPITTLISDANATVLTTAANQSTSTETWTTTGLATPVKQKLDVTFTPQMAGPIRWRVKVAKPSTTVYVCPKAELS
jgi:hypothetical protein